jgi:hypothetical protein
MEILEFICRFPHLNIEHHLIFQHPPPSDWFRSRLSFLFRGRCETRADNGAGTNGQQKVQYSYRRTLPQTNEQVQSRPVDLSYCISDINKLINSDLLTNE